MAENTSGVNDECSVSRIFVRMPSTFHLMHLEISVLELDTASGLKTLTSKYICSNLPPKSHSRLTPSDEFAEVRLRVSPVSG